ncbi:MAG: exopolysaccharide biosynthesis protein [Gammaproteobacteria bacterium]|nr:exopolysaccharide biosynthesis protein [Gammaproteobacteria bacterium]
MTSRADLLAFVRRHAARSAAATPLSLGEIADSLGDSAFSILCAVIALPFLTPLPLGPLATVAGFALALLGLQMLRGAPTPHLPTRARAVVLSPRVLGATMRVLGRILAVVDRLSRPRLQGVVEGPRGARLRGLVTGSSGLVMAVPLFGLPFNNALPALAVLLVSLAELEDDGVLAWVAVATLALASLYVVGVWLAVAVLGRETIALTGW